ncbi:hypothetical protein PtB15_7B370 [Puccinia triticina]|nr:hypothetical protein PtB15_7B370 [Puccinia triticina]
MLEDLAGQLNFIQNTALWAFQFTNATDSNQLGRDPALLIPAPVLEGLGARVMDQVQLKGPPRKSTSSFKN